MTYEAILLCLSLNIYHEANTEPKLGQLAVAHVTMNRAKLPGNICKVVYAPKQFSWTSQKSAQPTKEELRPARNLAVAVLNKKTKDPTNGATYFHNFSVKPKWKLIPTVTIGNHIFYKTEQ